MVLFLGRDSDRLSMGSTSEKLSVRAIESVEQAIDEDLLRHATVLAIAPSDVNPVKAIQTVHAADQHLSIIVLAEPTRLKQIKQAILFAPYIGKNTLVVSVSPELDLETVCRSAAVRTVQKRSFNKLHLSAKTLTAQTEKIKISQLGVFLECAPIAALVVSETNLVVNANQQAKRLLPSLELLGEDLGKYFPLTQAEAIKAFIPAAHSPEAMMDLSLQDKILALSAAQVYTDESEKHFLLLMIDVTNQRKETLRIQSILEALPQMAWTTNAEGLVTYFNQGWYFYTGQTEQEALGVGWEAVIHVNDAGKLMEQWKISVSSGVPFQQAARYLKFNGEYRWHLSRGTAIRNHAGEIIMWVGTCTDIHDQILLTEELERKVRERTHSLEVTNIELQQFAHVSSHDLQEPLRKIKTFAELLKEELYDRVDDTSKRYLDKIGATAERMSRSLKALLNYTQLQREEKFVPVDLNNILNQVLNDLELMITQKNAVIKAAQLPVINAVPIQMQQLFFNVLNNALKFSKKGIAPKIDISSRQLAEQEVADFPNLRRFKVHYEIVVKDNGVGFEQKYADQIFTIFQRLHGKSDFDGTGIGLSLVKKVVVNHGGEIRAKSAVGKGASFHVILPA